MTGNSKRIAAIYSVIQEMSDFFDEQGRTRVYDEAFFFVRRGSKPAENGAHLKNGHFLVDTN